MAHLRDRAPGRRRALWRAADRVAGGDVSGPAPYPAPARHGQQHRPSLACPVGGVGDGAALALRRPDGYCQRMLDAARRRGIASLTLIGQAPHYLQRTTNPAMRQALLSVVARLLDLELDVSPLDAAVQAFRTRCDQAVAQDAATQTYVQQLEQAYDATGDETPRPHRDAAFNPEQLMHELEDFLRQERERGAE